MPPPVPDVPRVLWGEARGRTAEPDCDGVVVEVARRLTRVKQWRKYREVVEKTRVPGSAGASFFAARVREWTPPDPWPRWRPPWLPAGLVALVDLVEANRGEPWTVELLRRYCLAAIRDPTPARRKRGRPATSTFNRTDDVVEAFVRDHYPRPDGSVSQSNVLNFHTRLGYEFQHLGPKTDPAHQLKRNRKRRRQQAVVESVPARRRPRRPTR
jgi:hypothetical protein